MVLPAWCGAASAVLHHIEPVLVLEQLGSCFFDTGLLLVVRDRSSNASDPGPSGEASRQKAMTDFFMTYHLITSFVPILPALLLAKLSDRGWRRAPVVVPLAGYVVSRLSLLLVLVLRLPLELMFGAAVLFGLSGGYCAFWPGIMTLASLGSSAADRSKALMRVELLYGATGLVGSFISGHLFQVSSSGLGNGVVLLILATLMNLLCFIHSIVLLQVKQVSISESEEDGNLLAVAEAAPGGIDRVNIVLLFAAAFLYDFAVGGAMDILGVFVLKEPLSWTAAQVGYGNSAGCTIFLTSFVGVILFRRCFSDVSLILIGMFSFASGIYFMSFVTATYMYYLARSLTMFALIPMPTIRSLLSKQVPSSSYGTTLTSLQLTLKVAGLTYIPAYTKIYQRTLEWFPGFIFTLSSIFTVLGMIPISILGCRSPESSQRYRRVQGD